MRKSRITVCALFCAFGVLTGQGAVISGSVSETAPDNFNLTTFNGQADVTVLDWAVWGEGTSTSLAPTSSKSGGTGISDLTDINPHEIDLRGLGQFGDFGQPSFQWSDGSQTVSASNVFAGIQHNASSSPNTDTGFELSVDGLEGVTRTLGFWFGSHRGTTRLEVSLNDAETYTYDLVANESKNNAFGFATIGFMPDSTSDPLRVKVSLITNTSPDYTGNTYLFGAALTQPVVVPELGSFVLLGLALGAMVFHRRTF